MRHYTLTKKDVAMKAFMMKILVHKYQNYFGNPKVPTINVLINAKKVICFEHLK